MALAVPYNPVPSVAPQSPGESISVSTPDAAFGVNIGNALQHLGSSTAEAGNEVFQRAVALQEVQNQADARAAQTEYATKAAQIQADFDAKTGKDSYTNLQDHLKQLAGLRTDIRGGLKTAMAQQHYDTDSLPFMQRMIFSSASHAATQQKSYTLDTYGAQLDMLNRQTEVDPTDDVGFQRNVEKARNAAAEAAMIHFGTHDPNDPIVQNAVQKETQRIVGSKIKGIARDQPDRAMQVLEANKTAVGDQYDQLKTLIETRGNTVASSNIADGVLAAHRQADGSYDATYQDMQAEVKAKAKEQYPDNPTLAETSTSVFDTKLIRARFASEQDKREALHQIDTAILTHNISDTQELFAIPGMDKVVERYGKFDPKGAAELQQHIFNINQAANRITRDDSLRYIYHGLANGGPDGKIDEFLSVDPYDPKWHLNATDAKAVVQKQFEVSKSMRTDPKVASAYNAIKTSMGGQLEALNIIGKNTDTTQFYAFKGALGAALEEWQMENKRPPTNEEIVQKIGPALVRQMGEPGSTVFGIHIPFTGNQEPVYNRLQKHVEEVIQAAKDKGIDPPSEDEVRRAYLQQTFQQLFGGSSGTSRPGQSRQPGQSGSSVPIPD